jgi:cytochrome c-type biogenesis protein CcmH
MNFIKFLLITFLYLAPVDIILAVEPDEVLTDLKLESRARDISANVRCVVCQNEPIDTSNSGVARDLRILIRERLLAGDSNKEVYKYLVDRYGNFILFKPPLTLSTAFLWFMPLLVFFLGVVILVGVLKKASPSNKSRFSNVSNDTKVSDSLENKKGKK